MRFKLTEQLMPCVEHIAHESRSHQVDIVHVQQAVVALYLHVLAATQAQ